MKISVLFFLIFSVTLSFGSPSDPSLVERQRREVDFFGNTLFLVNELIQKLENSAQQSIEAIRAFRDGLHEQGIQWIQKLTNDLEKFRRRINDVIQNFTDRFTNADAAVLSCIDTFRKEADDIFSETLFQSKNCANEHINEIGEMIEKLSLISSNATSFTSTAVQDLKNCTEHHQGFTAGSCLASVSFKIEYNGAVFLTQSGVLIARINLALTTLPAALEICAGARLVEAGVSSGKIVVDIGSCSTSSVFSSLTGNALL